MWLWKGQQQPWIEQSEELKIFMFHEVLVTQCDSTVQYILLLLYPQVWETLRALNTVELAVDSSSSNHTQSRELMTWHSKQFCGLAHGIHECGH